MVLLSSVLHAEKVAVNNQSKQIKATKAGRYNQKKKKAIFRRCVARRANILAKEGKHTLAYPTDCHPRAVHMFRVRQLFEIVDDIPAVGDSHPSTSSSNEDNVVGPMWYNAQDYQRMVMELEKEAAAARTALEEADVIDNTSLRGLEEFVYLHQATERQVLAECHVRRILDELGGLPAETATSMSPDTDYRN